MCFLIFCVGFVFAHSSLSADANFTVSGGGFSAPFFTFIDGDGQTPDFSTLPLYRGATYQFSDSGVSGTHPFMIGESYGDTSSSLVSGGQLNGSGGAITVTIPSDFNGSLYYFCTNHSSMIQEFTIATPNHVADLNSTVNLEMIWVEPGTFTMGQSDIPDASPENNVTLTKGFYLGKYEVTQAQYEAVMAGNTETDSNGNVISATPSQFSGNPNRPVEKLSWEDIQVFLSRLNEQQAESLPVGWAYVLPTEAQWEYACRAGSTTAYSWGDTINASDANWNHGNDANQTENVGQYAANPWGFFDMHGNVWEWSADAWGTYPSGAQTDLFNAGTAGSSRVIRGGSWVNPGTYLPSAVRLYNAPSGRFSDFGFRVGFQQVPDTVSPEEVFTVSGGQGTSPFYDFTNSDGQTVVFTSAYKLISGNTYEFVADNVSGTHPFMIGESYGDTTSSLVSGGPLTGTGGKIIVTIPEGYAGDLYYFCTNHSSMVQKFIVHGDTPLSDSNFRSAILLWYTAEENATAIYGHVSDWNTTAVTDMSSSIPPDFNENIGGWDTSNVTNMSEMFNQTSFNQDIGDWNTSNVTNMSGMFNQTSFNQDIGDWDTSSVKNFSRMFSFSYFNQDIGDWNLSSAENMESMFRGADSFSQNLGNWDTSNVTNLNSMFAMIGGELSIGISGWDVSRVVDMGGMFTLSNFNEDLSEWNVSSVINFSETFMMTSFDQDLSNWDISSASYLDDMFNPTAVSDANKGLIHESFASNPNWHYDWREFVSLDDTNFQTAVNLWFDDEAEANKTYVAYQ